MIPPHRIQHRAPKATERDAAYTGAEQGSCLALAEFALLSVTGSKEKTDTEKQHCLYKARKYHTGTGRSPTAAHFTRART